MSSTASPEKVDVGDSPLLTLGEEHRKAVAAVTTWPVVRELKSDLVLPALIPEFAIVDDAKQKLLDEARIELQRAFIAAAQALGWGKSPTPPPDPDPAWQLKELAGLGDVAKVVTLAHKSIMDSLNESGRKEDKGKELLKAFVQGRSRHLSDLEGHFATVESAIMNANVRWPRREVYIDKMSTLTTAFADAVKGIDKVMVDAQKLSDQTAAEIKEIFPPTKEKEKEKEKSPEDEDRPGNKDNDKDNGDRDKDNGNNKVKPPGLQDFINMLIGPLAGLLNPKKQDPNGYLDSSQDPFSRQLASGYGEVGNQRGRGRDKGSAGQAAGGGGSGGDFMKMIMAMMTMPVQMLPFLLMYMQQQQQAEERKRKDDERKKKEEEETRMANAADESTGTDPESPDPSVVANSDDKPPVLDGKVEFTTAEGHKFEVANLPKDLEQAYEKELTKPAGGQGEPYDFPDSTLQTSSDFKDIWKENPEQPNNYPNGVVAVFDGGESGEQRKFLVAVDPGTKTPYLVDGPTLRPTDGDPPPGAGNFLAYYKPTTRPKEESPVLTG